MDRYEQLEKLAGLREKGALSEREFEAEKAKIMAMAPPKIDGQVNAQGESANEGCLLGCMRGGFRLLFFCGFLYCLWGLLGELEQEKTLVAEPGRRTYNQVESQVNEAVGFVNILLDNTNRNLSDVASDFEGGPFESPHEANYTEDEYEKIEIGMHFYDVSILIGNGRINYGTLERIEGDIVIRSWLGFGEERLLIAFNKESETVAKKELVKSDSTSDGN